MKCQEFAAALSDYVDRRLDSQSTQDCDAHARSCARCGISLRDHQLVNSLLSSALPEIAPPCDRMWSKIRAQLPVPAAPPQPSFLESFRTLFLRGLVFAPIPALILLLGLLYWRQPGAGLSTAQNPGGAGTSLHSSPEQRQSSEVNQQRWDYVESGFKSYARSVRTRHTPR